MAVGDLLGVMQGTLGAVGKVFDVLGDQTMRVASLGPAVDAVYQARIVLLPLIRSPGKLM